MDTSDLAELIKGRRSIRIMQDKPVPQELLMQAMEEAEAQGRFRRLVPGEKIVMHGAPSKEVKRPRFKIPRDAE